MKTTTFQNKLLGVSIMHDKTYMDLLLANEIEYDIDEIILFQPFLPEEIIAYNGYKVFHNDENGIPKFVYAFVTLTYDSTKCIAFITDEPLDSLYLLDLEQAMHTGKLVYEGHDDNIRPFAGFDFDKNIEISRLLDTYIDLECGYTYEFNKIEEFPDGISGKKVLPNGDAVPVFLIKLDTPETTLVINEAGMGWKLLSKEEALSIFGK